MKNKNTGPITLINEVEAAAYLGVKHRTIQAWRLAGHVQAADGRYKGPKYYRIGARPMYTVADLNDWIASRQVG